MLSSLRLLSSPPHCLFGAVAGAASAATFILARVFGGQFMAPLAMSARPFFFIASRNNFLVRHGRREKSFVERHPRRKALVEGIAPQADMPRPLGQGHRLAFMGVNTAILPVVRLFRSGRPFTVFCAVGAIVVDALKGQALRLLAHIGKKLSEVIPSRVDLNASPSVASKVLRILVPTSVAHSHPNAMRPRAAHPVRHHSRMNAPQVGPHFRRSGSYFSHAILMADYSRIVNYAR